MNEYDELWNRYCKLTDRHIPEHMRDEVKAYLFTGCPPGGFFENVLLNDLVHAAGSADHLNERRLHDYAAWLYNVPMACWGTEEAVQKWIKRGGLNGLYGQADEGSGTQAQTDSPPQREDEEALPAGVENRSGDESNRPGDRDGNRPQRDDF